MPPHTPVPAITSACSLSAAIDTLPPLTVDFSCVIGSLNSNELCRLDRMGSGTYTAEGITKIADMLKVNTTLTSIRCAPLCHVLAFLLSAATDTF